MQIANQNVYDDLMHKTGKYDLKVERVNGSIRYDMWFVSEKIFSSNSLPLAREVQVSKRYKVDAEEETAVKVSAFITGFTDANLDLFIKGMQSTFSEDVTHLNLRYYFKNFKDTPSWLRQFPNLRSIDLSNSNVTDDELEKIISLCPNLITINLWGCKQITDKVFSFLPNLASISLAYCPKITPKGLAERTGDCKQLSFVSLRQMQTIRNYALKSLVLAAPNLTSIDLYDCALLTNGALRIFSKYCPNLLSIGISYCTNITDDGVLLLAQRCHKLKWVDFEGCRQLTERSVRPLIENCPDLTSLNLMWSPISREAFAQFNLRNFTYLNLGCCNIDDPILINLANQNPNLTTLGLIGCFEIRDDAIKAVAQRCHYLKTITLQMCTITDVSLKVLSIYCKFLSSITCGDCSQVTAQGVQNIKQHYPQITLISDF